MPTPLESLSPAQLRKVRLFDAFDLHDETTKGGRIQVLDAPRPGIDYGVGSDHAYGIKGRDRDAFCVMGKFPSDKHAKGYTIRQVAQVWAWSGERSHRVLYALLRYYNTALLCGERQVGLPTMRRLIDEYGYTRIYYDRQEAKKGRDRLDVLGIHRGKNDVTLTNLRLAVTQGDVELLSPELIAEMQALQWVSRTKEEDGNRQADERLIVKLSTGGSQDLSMSAMYAYHAARCLHIFRPPPELEYEPQSGTLEGRKTGNTSGEVSLARAKRR